MDARYFNLKATDGQPIGGIAAPSYDPSSVEVVACPYHDSRHGRPLDKTALKAVTEHWPLTLQATRALAGSSGTTHAAWRATMGLLHAPLWMQELGPTPVPVEMVGGVKVALGFAQVLTDALLSEVGCADRPLTHLGDGGALFDELDRDGRLLGQKHVCSGSRAMFEAFWTALAGGEDPLPAPWSTIPGLSSRLDWQLGAYGRAAAAVLSGEAHGRSTPWLYARDGGRAELALRLFPADRPPPQLAHLRA